MIVIHKFKRIIILLIIPFVLTILFFFKSKASVFDSSKIADPQKNNLFSTQHVLWNGFLKMDPPTGIYYPVDPYIFLTDKLIYKKNESIKIGAFNSRDTFLEIQNPYTSEVFYQNKIAN
tara:strand:- start:101 stop:457 length:357 start_codon:yes stop_codon:yes gene_type:complete